MERHCSRQSPFQPADQVYLDHLRLTGKDDTVDERFRAFELSTRPLSTFEIEEHQKRTALLQLDANDRWASIEQIHKNRAFTALDPCHFPPARANNTVNDIHRQLSGQVGPYPHPYLTFGNEGPGQRQSLHTRHDQRGYLEFEIADQKRRLARMGLGGQQSRWQNGTPRTSLPFPILEPPSHFARQTGARNEAPALQHPALQMRVPPTYPEQRNETPAYGHWSRERNGNVWLKDRAWQEAARRNLVRQQHGQQKIELPMSKPGNLYPGPTRITPIIRPPCLTVHDDNMEQIIRCEMARSRHRKARKAAEEAMLREEEEQYKAASSVPAPGTGSVKQLLVSVNKALEQKVEAAEIEAAKTDDEEHGTLHAQSQQAHDGPGDSTAASLERGKSFWEKYDKSYPLPRQSVGTQCSTSLVSASAQSLFAACSRHTRVSKGEGPPHSPRTRDLRAVIEAVNRASHDRHMQGPNKAAAAAPDPTEPAPLHPASTTVSISRIDAAIPSAALFVTGTDAPLLPTPSPQAEPTDLGSADSEGTDGESVEGATTEALLPGDGAVLQEEWEEVDGDLGGEGWSDVEEDLVEDV